MSIPGFKLDITQLSQGILQFDSAVEAVVAAVGDQGAKMLESYAKKNRPWQDQTGHARQRLHAESEKVAPKVARIALSHGVDYGVYLELAHEKRFAIIPQTIEEVGRKQIMPVLVQKLGNIK